jgi:hypothetical protein
MALMTALTLLMLTKGEDDAGSEGADLNLTVNIDGVDVIDRDPIVGPLRFLGFTIAGSEQLEEGKVGGGGIKLETPLETNQLTNSSIRLGSRTDDAWGPRHVLLFGSESERRYIPIAMELHIDRWLSTDEDEGRLTMPLRLVGLGNASTVLSRILILTYTLVGTDSPIQFQITAAGNSVLKQEVPDTEQDDFDKNTMNLYILDADVPFTKGNVLANGGIHVGINGPGSWRPQLMQIFGLDTASGHPQFVVPLVAITDWSLGTLGPNQPSVSLPVT